MRSPVPDHIAHAVRKKKRAKRKSRRTWRGRMTLSKESQRKKTRSGNPRIPMKACIVVISVPLLAQRHLSQQYNCSSDWHNAAFRAGQRRSSKAKFNGEVQAFSATHSRCPGATARV